MTTAFPQYWFDFTHLGAAGLMLPVALVTVVGLWFAGKRVAVLAWGGALGLGVAVVLASKIAFMGWGIGSARLNFTGFSGHTMLASAIFPVWLGWLFAALSARLAPFGVALGLGVGALVGWSRLALGAHSESEVVTAWLLGSVVSLAAMPALRKPVRSSGWAWLVVMLLLALSVDGSLADYLPTRLWELRIALRLSGRDKPYTRAELLRGERPTFVDKKSRPGGWQVREDLTTAHDCQGNPTVLDIQKRDCARASTEVPASIFDAGAHTPVGQI